jgi:urate oxidase
VAPGQLDTDVIIAGAGPVTPFLDGKPHGHGFTNMRNGNPVARIRATRDNVEFDSGVQGCMFMKTTVSAWVNYVKDEATTLPETRDRICAASIDAIWRYTQQPRGFQ